MKVVNAEGLVLGRMASSVAKMLLDGEDVTIVNAEKTIISGRRKMIFERYRKKRELTHSWKGPYYPRQPDRIVRRTVRGMLPYKKTRGKEAFKRLQVYIDVPREFEDSTYHELPNAVRDISGKAVLVADISRHLGANF